MKFKGNMLSNIRANHAVIIEEPYFNAKGFGSFNYYSFKALYENDGPWDDVRKTLNEFDTGKDYYKAMVDAQDHANGVFHLPFDIIYRLGYETDTKGWHIVYYSQSAGKNVVHKFTSAQLKEYALYYESGGTGDKDKEKWIRKIMSCVNNCAVINFGEKDPGPEKAWQYQACFFMYPVNNSSLDNSSDERILVNKHAHRVSMVPRTATGRKYSNTESRKVSSSPDSEGNYAIGVKYDQSSKAGAANTDSVAGEIKLNLNPNTGYYESGTTQMLARLLEDLDSANVSAFDMSSSDLDDGTDKEPRDFYDRSGSDFSGQFTEANAIPISMENGNPNTYGPNFIQCTNGRRIEKIRAINRSNARYEAGQIVMVNYIDGEWVVTDFGGIESEPSVSTFGRWGFWKGMANSDVLFRDAISGNRIQVADAQNWAQSQCWKNAPEQLKKVNYNNENPPQMMLCKYAQCTSFDYPYYNIKNPASAPALFSDQVEDIYAVPPNELHSFWGALFTEGFTSNSLTAIESKTYTHFGGEDDATGNSRRLVDMSKNAKVHPWPTAFRSVLAGSSNQFSDFPLAPGTMISDSNATNCPADIGTCDKIGSKYGMPQFFTPGFIDILNKVDNPLQRFTQLCSIWRSGGEAYVGWIGEVKDGVAQTNTPPVPVNNKSIIFMPLGADTALADDNRTVRSVQSGNFGGDTFWQGRTFKYFATENIKAIQGSVFSGRFHKYQDRQKDAFAFDNSEIDLGKLGAINKVYSGGAPFDAHSSSVPCIPYHECLKRKTLEQPIHALRHWDSSAAADGLVGPGVVGITAARVKIQRNNGGSVDVTTKGMYGRGGTGALSTPVQTTWNAFANPLMGAQSDSGGLSVPGGKPTWGSSNDKIYSFGSLNLFSMAWDAWPDDQTIFIPEYMIVLHFNKGESGSDAETKTVDMEDELPDGQILESLMTVDKADPDTDTRIPSIRTGEVGNWEIEEMDVGTKINFDTNVEENINWWKVDTSRRGALVTGGLYFLHKAIGLSTDYTIQTKGKGFATGDIVALEKDASIKITEVDGDGGIVKFEFEAVETPTGFKGQKRGTGFMPKDFSEAEPDSDPPVPKGRLITVSSDRAGAEAASILFNSGEVYEMLDYDEGVQRRDGINGVQHVSPGSGDGSNTIGPKWSLFSNTKTIQLSSNKSSPHPSVKNNYEIFFFFQNDIDLVRHNHTKNAGLRDWFNGITLVNGPVYLQMDLS